MNKILQLISKHKELLELRQFKAGETIFLENDTCKAIGVLKKGEISIKSYLSSGKEITYNTINEGQMFGNNLIFSSNPFYRGDVIAEKESEIYFIDKDTLTNILKTDDEFLIEYLSEQSDFSKTLNFKIKLLTIQSAEDRIQYYLTFNKGMIIYKTITKLANELYMSRESLSRTLKKMRDNGIIKTDGKKIALMVEKSN